MAKKKPSKKTLQKVAKKKPKQIRIKTSPKRPSSPTKIKAAVPKPKRSKTKVSEEEKNATMRKVLIQKREEIVKEARVEISKYIKGETRQLVDTALDNGDWSVVDLSEDISLQQLSRHRETLLKIDEALRKLAEGTYGICEECGEEISKQRLEVLPFAIYCRDCQEKREELEKIEGIME